MPLVRPAYEIIKDSAGTAYTPRRNIQFNDPAVAVTDSPTTDTTIVGAPAGTAASLDGLIWTLPNVASLDATSCSCPFICMVEAQMNGNPSTLYTVTLRFRGVVEVRSYSWGTRTGRIYQGGARDPTNGGGTMSALRNTYRIEIEDPSDYYFLNAWDGVEATTTRTFAFDQNIAIPIRGGAWVRLAAFADYEWTTDVPNGAYLAGEAKNQDGTGANPQSVVDGVGLLVAQPYDGQFIQMNVVSVA